MIYVVCIAAVLALSFAAFNFLTVKHMPEGTKEMQEIAEAIRIGANAFIHYEYKILYMVVAVVAVLMAVVTTWHAAVALILGSVMSVRRVCRDENSHLCKCQSGKPCKGDK